jgi:hypothetical protein
MATLYDDPEYNQLKQQMRSKEVSSYIWNGIAGLTGLGAAGLAGLAIASGGAALPVIGISATAALAGAAALGAVTLVTGFIGWRKETDISYDRQELEARRNAINLSRAMGASPSLTPEQRLAIANEVQREQGQPSWREREDARRQQAQQAAASAANAIS